MARKLRLEFPGACYHVINRGNYRAQVFATEKTRAAFEACVFEACEKSGWLLHAFVVMNNHYHLALETPQGNLVAGMQWLQATFANRFNRLRGERGHLFQGRYKSLLVESGEALGQVCHYVHLNPVRAGLVTVDDLASYRASSYWHLWQKKRPSCLHVETALTEAGALADTAAGRKAYAKFLAWQATEGPAGKNKAYVSMSRGWALGTQDFKTALIKDHALAESSRAWEKSGVQEIQETRWTAALASGLAALGKSAEDADTDLKSAPWKVALAAKLKQTTQANNRWLAEHLHMGTPIAVSHHTGQLRRGLNPAAAKLTKRLGTLNIKA
ncbi:MAG: transposase [Candidatus Didemnitutus sp.]|nr:transposase [Candidatus Didemnitutus sp.]